MRTERPPAAPVFWRAVAAADADEEWEHLRRWVEEFTRRFVWDARTVPSCWYRHSAMVEMLVALRDHEQASYEYSTSKTTAIEFIRAARDVGALLRDLANRTGCTAAQHRADPQSGQVIDDHDWNEHVGMDRARRRANERDGDEGLGR